MKKRMRDQSRRIQIQRHIAAIHPLIHHREKLLIDLIVRPWTLAACKIDARNIFVRRQIIVQNAAMRAPILFRYFKPGTAAACQRRADQLALLIVVRRFRVVTRIHRCKF
ncbi:hypothetical protein D3C71_1882670 [compost metagenome]